MPDHQLRTRPPAYPAPGPRTAGSRAAAAFRAAAPALAVYAVRALGLLAFWAAASAAGKDPLGPLSGRWDSVWYQRIAENGYRYTVTLPDGSVHSDLAFFPLLPALERSLSEVTPLTLGDAGLLVAWTAGLLAAWGIYAIGAHLRGRRTGVVLAALWGVYPTAFVQSMAYTETLFTALAAWALYAVLRGRWIVAGALCVLAGLTRPTAAALIAALAITAAVTLVREYRDERRAGPVLRRNARTIMRRGARTAGLAGVRGVRGRPRGQPVRLLRRPGAVGQQHRRRPRARRLHRRAALARGPRPVRGARAAGVAGGAVRTAAAAAPRARLRPHDRRHLTDRRRPTSAPGRA